MGQDAASRRRTTPTRRRASPRRTRTTPTVHLAPAAATRPDAAVRLYVGDYEARATPVADTDPATAARRTPSRSCRARTVHFVATGPGLGHQRFTSQFRRAGRRTLRLSLPQPTWPPTAAGATVTGDGGQPRPLDRRHRGAPTGRRSTAVAGKQVTVDLAGDRPQTVNTGQRQRAAAARPIDRPGRPAGAQNRFSALRSFEILACNARRADCADRRRFRLVYTQPGGRLPGGRVPAARRRSSSCVRSASTRPMATHVRLAGAGQPVHRQPAVRR